MNAAVLELAQQRGALFISPHLDDAVFACGALIEQIPGAHLATVFTGVPADPDCRTPWDERCGFHSAEKAMLSRRIEDMRAAALLGAKPVHLGALDAQYRAADDADGVSGPIGRCARALNPRVVFFPLGLFHADHRAVARACLRVREEHGSRAWIAYEDAIYRTHPGLVGEALQILRARGLWPALIEGPACSERKREAVRLYASQLRGLGQGSLAKIQLPERYWALDEQSRSLIDLRHAA